MQSLSQGPESVSEAGALADTVVGKQEVEQECQPPETSHVSHAAGDWRRWLGTFV